MSAAHTAGSRLRGYAERLWLAGFAGIAIAVAAPAGGPGDHGPTVLVAALAAGAAGAASLAALTADDRWIPPCLVALAVLGPALCYARPDSPAVAFVFAAVGIAGSWARTTGQLTLVAAPAVLFVPAYLASGGPWLGALAYCFGFVVAALAAVTRRQRTDRASQAELLLAQMQRVHEEQIRSAALTERARIARDIHDVLAHSLSALSVQLEAARMLLDTPDGTARAADHVDRARWLTREGLAETRRALAALRDDVVPLETMLRELVEAPGAAPDPAPDADATAIRLELAGLPRDLPPATALALYRAAQEALTNVRRHAPGARVTVGLAHEPDAVVLTVADRRPAPAGSGAPAPAPAAGGGYGLVGMRERTALLGGTLRAGPVPARDGWSGWDVVVRLPTGPEPVAPTPTPTPTPGPSGDAVATGRLARTAP